MALQETISGDLLVTRDIIISGPTLTLPATAILSGPDGFLSRDALVQESLVVQPVPFTAMRKDDDLTAVLPGTATGPTGYLGLTDADWAASGTAHTLVGLVTAGNTQTQRAAFLYRVAVSFVPDGDMKVRVRGHTTALGAGDTATFEVHVFGVGRSGVLGQNLVSGGAMNCPITTAANLDFSISTQGVNPGDTLAVRLISVANQVSGTPITNTITQVAMLCDTKG